MDLSLDILNEVLRSSGAPQEISKTAREVPSMFNQFKDEIRDCLAASASRKRFVRTCDEILGLLRTATECTRSKQLAKWFITVQELRDFAQKELDRLQGFRNQLQRLGQELTRGDTRHLEVYSKMYDDVYEMNTQLLEKLQEAELLQLTEDGPLNTGMLESPLAKKVETLVDKLSLIDGEPPDIDNWQDPSGLEDVIEEGHQHRSASEGLEHLPTEVEDCQEGLAQREHFKSFVENLRDTLASLDCLQSKVVQKAVTGLTKVLTQVDKEISQLTADIATLGEVDKMITAEEEVVGYEKVYHRVKQDVGYIEHLLEKLDLATVSEAITTTGGPVVQEAIKLIEAVDGFGFDYPTVEGNWQTPGELKEYIVYMQKSQEQIDAEYAASLEKVAVKTKPSFPNLSDEYQPTDPVLWKRVLEVATGDRLDYTQNDRTIHAPNEGRGYRNMPNNPKGIAWAVKQYNGYDGNWKGKEGKVACWAEDVVPKKAQWFEDEQEIQTAPVKEDAIWETKQAQLVDQHVRLFRRLAAGGTEVTQGPMLKELEAAGLVRLAGVSGIRHYWDLTETGKVTVQKCYGWDSTRLRG